AFPAETACRSGGCVVLPYGPPFFPGYLFVVSQRLPHRGAVLHVAFGANDSGTVHVVARGGPVLVVLLVCARATVGAASPAARVQRRARFQPPAIPSKPPHGALLRAHVRDRHPGGAPAQRRGVPLPAAVYALLRAARENALCVY